MATPAAILSILVKTQGAAAAAAELRALDTNGRKAATTVSSLGRSSERTGKSLRLIGHGAAYALGAGGFGGGMYALFDITKKSIAEFKESERVSRQTAAALRSTGGAAGISAKGVSDLANALKRKTAIDDEAIQASENLLLTFTNVRNVVGKNNDIFNQATQATLDMATAMNQGATPSVEKLHNTAILVGKALQDPINGMTALRRVGVALTTQQQEQIKTLVQHGHGLKAQKIILAELTKEFGGSAAAQKTAAKTLNTALGDVAETIGRALNPSIKSGSAWLAKFIIGMQDGTGEGGRFAKSVNSVTDSLRPYLRVLGQVAGVLLKGLVPALEIAAKYLRIQATIWYSIEKAILTVYRVIVDKVLWALQHMISAIGGLAGVAKHLPFVGGAFKKVQSAAKDAADEIGRIRTAIHDLPSHKTIKINVVSGDQGVFAGDKRPPGRGGAAMPKSFTGKGAKGIANQIIRAGRASGASDKQILAALEAGVVESGLRNLPYGDKDSVGVFQQRPSQGWKGLMNVPKAAREFFQHAKGVAGQGRMTAGQLAQAVQRSKYPDRYDKARQKALGFLGGGGGGTTQQGTFNTGTIPKGMSKDDPRIETMALNSAIKWLRKNYPGVGFLLEDKGGANQHLHINTADHKKIRSIARALNDMGYAVGEYGGKPIPGVGGITTLKHKHYGAADHYHGGAIDVNSDGQLTRAFGIAKKKASNVFKAPSITQESILAYIQKQLDHWDLMVKAGLTKGWKATIKKRQAIKASLPGLEGDARLQALVMLKELGGDKTPAQKTWTQQAKQRLAMAVIQANPGNVANLPAGVFKAAGAAATMQNPWMQAFQQNLTNQVGSGAITQAQADQTLKAVLEKSLPFLSGQDAADVATTLHTIATNTADTARAALDTANSIRASAISDAGFLGGLTGPAAAAVQAALAPYGISALPGGGSISELGNSQAAVDLAKGDIATLMGEVAAGQVTFADVWPQIRDDLGVIASGAADSTVAVNAATEAVDALKAEVKKQNDFASSVMTTQTGVLWKALGDLVSGQIAGYNGYQGRAATAGAGSTYRL